MRTATSLLLLLALLALDGVAAMAQSPSPAAPVPDAQPPESSGRSTEPGDRASRSLSDELSRSQGVIEPPATGDLQSVVPPPSGHGRSMPVIPPPGTPGGNPEVQPK